MAVATLEAAWSVSLVGFFDGWSFISSVSVLAFLSIWRISSLLDALLAAGSAWWFYILAELLLLCWLFILTELLFEVMVC